MIKYVIMRYFIQNLHDQELVIQGSRTGVCSFTFEKTASKVVDRLGCSASIKMALQPCGGTIANIANTVHVFTTKFD